MATFMILPVGNHVIQLCSQIKLTFQCDKKFRHITYSASYNGQSLFPKTIGARNGQNVDYWLNLYTNLF